MTARQIGNEVQRDDLGSISNRMRLDKLNLAEQHGQDDGITSSNTTCFVYDSMKQIFKDTQDLHRYAV